ncbi:F-box-like protein [Ceratobasidium sp. AG-Ba]|nr:F-box-like protein [Ceratobasidium sp. AG-Ba]
MAYFTINKLYSEILARIFAISNAKSPCVSSSTQRHALSDILLVCTRWYNIAVNTPPLWSHVDISIKRWGRASCLHGPEVWLSRSSSLPIHVHIADPYPNEFPWSEVDPDAAALFGSMTVSSLRPHIARIRSLTIFGMWMSPAARAIFAAHPAPAWASLKMLDIREVGCDDLDSSGTLKISSLAKLLELDLSILSCSPMWPSMNEICELLSNCPEMHTLRLGSDVPVDQLTSTRQEPIFMPGLKVLEISTAGAPLLSRLQTQSSELDLKLSGFWPDHMYPDSLTTLQSFLARSRVAALTLREPNHRHELFSTLLPQIWTVLPCLRCLCFDATVLEPDVLEPATLMTLDFGSCFPNLKYFCIAHTLLGPESISQLNTILATVQVEHLFFFACRFTSPMTEALYPDMDGWGIGEIPEDIKHSILGLARQVVVRPSWSRLSEYYGVDPFTREMLQQD